MVWHTLEWPIALLWFALASLIKLTASAETEESTHDGPAVYVNWHRYQPFVDSHQSPVEIIDESVTCSPLAWRARKYMRTNAVSSLRGTP